MYGKNVLVRGALGFIGHHLTGLLVRSGASVSVLCRSGSVVSHGNHVEWADRVTWHVVPPGESPADVYDAAAANADVVFDLAGLSGAVASNRAPLSSMDSNCRDGLMFIEACSRSGRKPRFVFASSRLVYGSPTYLPVPESAPLRPASMYAAHKLALEHCLHVYGHTEQLTYTIARISNPFGQDNRPQSGAYNVVNTFVRRALEGKPVTVFGDGLQLRDFLYIDDLLSALTVCATEPSAANQVVNIGSGQPTTLRFAAELICRAAGHSGPVYAPWPAEYLSVESGDYVADLSHFQNLTGWSPRWDIPAALHHAVDICRGTVALSAGVQDGITAPRAAQVAALL